jgi:hypothetical protein
MHAHVALVNLEPEVAEFLRVCLFQMGIKSLALNQRSDIARRKFEGFVVDLRQEDAQGVLDCLRASERNRRAVIFGIYSEPSQLRNLSKYGINAVIQWPAKRTEAVKVLRSAQTLLVHELRRYARIPLATAVEVVIRGEKHQAISRELSGGGMSLTFGKLPNVSKSDYIELLLVIPPGKALSLKGVVCWIHENDNLVGVQFMQESNMLAPVRSWIDDYLGIS